VSVDLILINPSGRVGLGLRRNEPAKGYFYFPGGRIFKGERIEQTCGRVLQDELGVMRDPVPMTICGVNNWFFKANFAGAPGVSTHYVALAVKVSVTDDEIDQKAVQSQHKQFAWFTRAEIMANPQVHADVKHVIDHLQAHAGERDIKIA
jgi:colanic acid biosynthesis protein WcaH